MTLAVAQRASVDEVLPRVRAFGAVQAERLRFRRNWARHLPAAMVSYAETQNAKQAAQALRAGFVRGEADSGGLGGGLGCETRALGEAGVSGGGLGRPRRPAVRIR